MISLKVLTISTKCNSTICIPYHCLDFTLFKATPFCNESPSQVFDIFSVVVGDLRIALLFR